MKRKCTLFILLVFNLQLVWALPQSDYIRHSPEEAAQTVESQATRKDLRQERRLERFAQKWDKIAAKLQKKEVKGTMEIWDDDRFRLGVILLAGALALGIISMLISLGGLINFIAGLLALGGVVLVIWSLVETYV